MPVNNTNINKPNFKSSFRIYPSKAKKEFDIFKKDFVRTSTNLFREDLDWQLLMKYIKKHFSDKEKVNTYSLACSDGSEAYSFIISVIESISKEMQSKFLPVTASDIDDEILNVAKNKRINLYSIEFFTAEKNNKFSITKYFRNPGVSVMIKGDDISESDTILSYEPIQELKDAVEFKKSDILTELKNIQDNGNSVILCRNVFPYLTPEYTDRVIKTAKNQLKDGSLFIIGDYDELAGIDEKLTHNGFCKISLNKKNLNCNNIYKRKTNK